MPRKFNADRGAKIPKQKHGVTIWAEKTENLRRRGYLTVWISEEAFDLWTPARRTTPGGQPVYSDLAIETCLTLGIIFQPAAAPDPRLDGLNRQAALGRNCGTGFSTLSCRGKGLTLCVQPRA